MRLTKEEEVQVAVSGEGKSELLEECSHWFCAEPVSTEEHGVYFRTVNHRPLLVW